MDDIKERNKQIEEIMRRLYNEAASTKIIDNSDYSKDLETIFSTTSWGFREIVLTVSVAMLADKNFRATKDFYACHPRAIFEKPMKTVLIEKNLPHKQSGVLNVAKGQRQLDEEWVSKRRAKDQPACQSALNLIKYMEKHSEKVENVGISVMRKLIEDKKELKSLDIKVSPTSDPLFLFNLCKNMIIKATDRGNTPQRICGYLLENFHKSLQTGVVVTGINDSASTTSTTSKKPGDINEESKDGKIFNVYEITVKPFSEDRVRDSFNCLIAYNNEHKLKINEVIVICRSDDCHPDMEKTGLDGTMGIYKYNGISYHYWNIFEWISFTIQHTPPYGRESFYKELNAYVADINTPQNVKQCWKELHSNLKN